MNQLYFRHRVFAFYLIGFKSHFLPNFAYLQLRKADVNILHITYLIFFGRICFIAWGTLVPHAQSIWATLKLAPATDHG